MSTTRKILTKQQVEALLGEYSAAQTDAAKQAEEAYNREADTQRENQQKTLQDEAAKTQKTAGEAYDKQTVKTLIGKRRLAEQLASLGLSRSGAAAENQRSATRAGQIAARQFAAARDAARATLNQKSEALYRETEAKKQKNTASSQKTLKNRIAEKRLSLSKLMY